MSAEPKRVSFMTIDTSSDFLKKPEKEANTGVKQNKTLRIDLEIFEPDEYKFPEYNYKKLIYIEKKKIKKLAKIPNGLHNDDPLGAAEDDDVARIAREMEAKYGTGSSYSKASRMEFDRGIGYDDNDSFIDNTEAYDEQIPEDLETVRGGFYINSGLLEYKKTPNFERPGDEIRMPKAKKRALSTSSESSDSERENDKSQNKSAMPEKPKKKKTHSEKKIKSATSSSDEQGKAAKKLKKEKLEKSEKPKEVIPIPPPPPVKEPEKEKKKFTEKETIDDSKKVIKTTTVKDMLRAKRDNLRKLEQGKSSGGTTTTTDDDDGSESVSSLAGSESSHESTHEETTAPAAPMNGSAISKELSFPPNFSPELVQLITNLKQYAESTANKNSSNFFDNHVKEQLIKVDSVAKSHSTQVRVQVYHQLETFIPCTRKTILAKVSRYRTQQADSKVKVEIKKLKTFINTTMPDLVRKYDEDYKNYENIKNIQQVVGDSSMEHKAPRKKYHWNESSRQVLSDVVQLIQELYKVSKVKKETIDEYTLKYLKDHLVPLWPEGWIKIDDFTKELERKKKKDAKAAASQGASPSVTATNGNKQSSTTQPPQPKTDLRMKIEIDTSGPTMNGKSVSGAQLSPQQGSTSVIKKASDHSINSIMSSSPSPPIHSSKSTPTPVQIEPAPTKTRVIDLDKLSSPNDLLKVSQKDMNRSLPKYSQQPQHPMLDVSAEKIRISDGSDSDCAIIDSPIKTTIKPQQQQQQFPHHMNNNKLNHSLIQQPHQHLEMKKTKKHDDNYSNLIKNIASLTDPKKNNSSFLSSPLSTSLNEQRKMDTAHAVNGTATNEHFVDPPKTSKGYNNNLHYSINELIVNTTSTNRNDIVKGNKSSEYQKQYTNNNNNNSNSNASLVHNISVITSTNDAGKSSYAMPPVLNLSNKK